MKNIILIGFMGTGKTEIGRRIASRLAMDFIDADSLIEKNERIKISEIFAKKGEPYFRDLETKLILGFKDLKNTVIATGGGVILRQENVKMLKDLGPLILLWSRPEKIFERLEHTQDRPLIEGEKQKKIKSILEGRAPLYKKVADFEIDTSQLSLDQAADRIIKWVKK